MVFIFVIMASFFHRDRYEKRQLTESYKKGMELAFYLLNIQPEEA